MFEAGRLRQVTAEMRKHKPHILSVSKSRCLGTEKVQKFTGETALHSG